MKYSLFSCFAVLLVGLAASDARAQAKGDPQQIAAQVKQIFTTHCYRCHGQFNRAEGGFGYVLDLPKLVGKKIVAGDPGKSRIYKRMHPDLVGDMPYDDLTKPTSAEIETVKKWIEIGAPSPKEESKARPFVSLQDELKAMFDHLKSIEDKDDRKYVRFFTLRHLHNMPPDVVLDRDLPLYQSAVSKLINSLSWENEIAVPQPIGPHGVILAVDISKLDWHKKDLWHELAKFNPYALRHDEYPKVAAINEFADDIYRMTGTKVPAVRADWFVSAASRPPLYHILAQIPHDATALEKRLGVHALANIRDGEVLRAGFNASGVSNSNRLVERHKSSHGAYWKSYDFKSSVGFGNLFIYPLGPRFNGNLYDELAFKHDGGEIIFNLPNGLQAYMLVDGKDKRIDAGPIEVVADGKRASGTPQVVNGLSCMSCHQHGMIRLKDQVRSGSILGDLAGPAGDRVRKIYPEPKTMDEWLDKDEQRFLVALEKATAKFLKAGPDKDKSIRDFPESISAIARWYQGRELTSLEAARELGLENPRLLEQKIDGNEHLSVRLGLYPLTKGKTVQREVWESMLFFNSPYQDAAAVLKYGVPATPK